MSKKPQVKAQKPRRSNAVLHWLAAITSVIVLVRSAHHGINHAAAVAAVAYLVVFVGTRALLGGRK